MRAALLLLLAGSAWAQLEILRVGPSGEESPAGSRQDAGLIPAGDFSDIRLRVRNRSAVFEQLQQLRVAGTGFQLEGTPPLPVRIAPGSNVDFRLRFAPPAFGSFSGTLFYGDRTLLVTGRCPEQATLAVLSDAGWRPVTAAIPVDFGGAERGQRLVRHFRLRNETPSVTATRSVRVTPPYELSELPLPAELVPGSEVQFEVSLLAPRAGLFRGNMELDGRLLPLEARVTEPPLPAMLLEAEAIALSARQIPVQVRFAERARGNGTVRLQLTHEPSVAGIVDPAILFPASGSTSLDLAVREGETGKEVVLQTGTTAGTIRLSLAGAQPVSIRIAEAAMNIDSVSGIRTTNGLELRVRGFDNTRSSSQLAFTFYGGDGRVIGAGPVVAQVENLFRAYFRSSALGGMFGLQALFPVAGNPAEIAAVEIEASNSAGTARSPRVSF